MEARSLKTSTLIQDKRCPTVVSPLLAWVSRGYESMDALCRAGPDGLECTGGGDTVLAHARTFIVRWKGLLAAALRISEAKASAGSK